MSARKNILNARNGRSKVRIKATKTSRKPIKVKRYDLPNKEGKGSPPKWATKTIPYSSKFGSIPYSEGKKDSTTRVRQKEEIRLRR